MSKLNTYTHITAMPNKFDYYEIDWGTFPVDLHNNPDGVYEKKLVQALWSFYGPFGWNDSTRFSSKPEIERLIDRFGYSLSHDYNLESDENETRLVFTLKTEALGEHLDIILNTVLDELYREASYCREWVNEARMKPRGWQNFDAKRVQRCKHKFERLQIMNDRDGSIVEVLECNKCKELKKRVI